MNLESFSNELLLDLFEYVPPVSLLRAFYNLNVRFNNLILIHFQSFNLNCRSVSQRDFNLICQEYLPSIADYIVSLSLSNGDDTPEQIELFLQHGLTLYQFIHLKSLSICDLCSREIMNTLMVQWIRLENLTHLTLAGCYVKFDQINAQRLIDSIWSLSKLIYCYLNLNFGENNIFIPTVMSSSLKYLFIWGSEHCQNEISALIKQTPCLRHFSVLLNIDSNNDNDVQEPFLSITQLDICISRIDENRITKFLQNMPNLYRMTVDMSSLDDDNANTILNGYQWENIIHNNLSNLRIFRFKMEFRIVNENNREEKINELINSFRSPFWLEKHKWFIRCHWNPTNTSSFIYFYTLPYSYSYFNFDHSMIVKSTSPNENMFIHYNCVHNLTYESLSNEDIVSSPIQFANLQSLSLKLPIDGYLYSMIQKFDQLKSLSVQLNDDDTNISYQFQFFLDNIPNLHSLRYSSCSAHFPDMSFFEFQHSSIHHLDLRGYNQYFTDEQCIMLTHSLLAIQCEILFIRIQNHRMIFYLLHNMINLRTLNVQCEDANFDETREDNFIVWLKEHLPSTYIVSRDMVFQGDIRIWIR
ncbi:unnamed protein product [Rotaria socialis]|uniref:F-box domain-containing protein n=1 Tax=Rotaria socialis TaxID=392032 RepID=A0A817PWY1_9BILA|nr:unnamed protein product [Rotaria socialis]CAF4211780.1 unnamed protein product [Rotaria socialis]